MKNLLIPASLALAAMMFLSGCIAYEGGRKTQQTNATLGQQLVDLQKAKESKAITEEEYQAQKAKLLQN